MAMLYQESGQNLRAAEAALKVAEKAAVHAGLRHTEREPAEDDAQVLTTDAHRQRPATGTVRVRGGVTNLRHGTGLSFQRLGQAQEGETRDILAEAEERYQVRTQDGLEGWVSKPVVTPEAGL